MFLPSRENGEEWLGVVIAVPEPWISTITEMRLALGDPLAEKVPAHITLMPPIAVPAGRRADVLRHLRNVTKAQSPFKLSLRGSGTFMPVSPVVYLNVNKGASHCKQLAEDIRSGPLDYKQRFPYHPHVTLAQGLAEAQLKRGLAMGADMEASWRVPGIRLDRVAEDGSYVSTAIFDFQAATS
mgnify:CR=1 FL=1